MNMPVTLSIYFKYVTNKMLSEEENMQYAKDMGLWVGKNV